MLPKGTVIECVAHYDNSANNRYNPDPKAKVLYGEQTWEEMLDGFLDLGMPVTQRLQDVAKPKPAPSATGADSR